MERAGSTGDRGHQVLIERAPRSARLRAACAVLSLTGVVILIACALTATGSPLDVIGLVLFLPFGVMALKGTYWAWRRGSS
jgi:hypothetical protein